MSRRRRNWSEDLRQGTCHDFRILTRDIGGMKKGERVLRPSAQMVDAMIRAIPVGQSSSIVQMRKQLARRHRADVCCPVYMGFRLRVVVEAALEAHRAGIALTEVTPVWRLLDEGAPTLKKLAPRDAEQILAWRRAEGLVDPP